MGEGLHGDTPGSFGAAPEPADAPIPGSYGRISSWPARFCAGNDPFAGIVRTTRDVKITQPDGTVVFELADVEAPDFWSDTACKIAAQKYFVNAEGKVEKSVFDMVMGVASAIATSGLAQGYFDDRQAATRFCHDLAYLLIHQKGAFNSPVWFNVRRWHTWGIPGGPGNWGWDDKTCEVMPVARAYERPQGSACFIHTVEDNLVDDDGIADFVKKEMRLFKYGSGSGANFSRIREANARLTPGGKASGLMSFLDVFDKAAGATKSGGTCLAPHQRVYTAGQGPVAVSELAQRNDGRFIALSYDPPAGRFKAKRAQAWKSGHKLVLRVTTDKGVFELSEDHPFKLSTGEYRLARDLRPGHSLFPCSVDMQHGHLRVHLRDGRKGKEFLHRLVAGDVMGESLEGLVVHHIDENRHNNDPVNLRVFTQAEHATEHAEDRVREGTHLFQQTTYPKPGALNGMHATAAFWSDEARVAKYRQAQADVLAKSGRAPEMQEYAAEQKMLNTAYRVLNAGFSIDTFESYVDGRKAVVGRIGSITKLRRQITDRFGSYAGFVQKVAEQNHRVVDVAVVGNMDVYDVEVECPTPDDKSPETGHNFVVWPTDDRTGSGVVVSNSRRAAKMVVLDMDHPEILDFIRWKVKEEKKAHALIAAGFSGGMEGEAYRTVGGQNANNSVRVTDAFMHAVEAGGTFQTKSRVDGRVCATLDARAVWREIAEAAWFCADPGVQYHDTINAWHTTPNAGPITGSNPCCFTGETLVDTSEGRISFAALEAMSREGRALPHVFAFDTDSRLPRLVPVTRVWVAGETNTLVEVRTERGVVLRCTPEHRFLTHAGDYVAARDLTPGMRLRKIGRGENEARGRRRSIQHRITDAAPNGCEYQARWMWEQIHGPVPEGFEVHHKNHDSTDDRISNFELLPVTDHRVEHSTGENNPRFLDVGTARLLEVWESVAASDHGKPSKVGVVSVARWNRYVTDHGLKGQIPLARGDGRIRGMSWDAFSTQMRQAQADANDRVASVTPIVFDTPVQVYDLESPETHNFAVTDGASEALHTLVVHNSEYMHLDNSACNLASLKLTTYPLEYGVWAEDDDFARACEVFLVAQDILVDFSSYPTKAIAEGAHRFRQLGLGYADLGGALMMRGTAYDSLEGRAFAAWTTMRMQYHAAKTSVALARRKGPFDGYAADAETVGNVFAKHGSYARELAANLAGTYRVVSDAWANLVAAIRTYGMRNAQLTLLAPTGTIGFLMDVATTGVEPILGHIQYKTLIGGGLLKLVNPIVDVALAALGYDDANCAEIRAYVEEHGHVEGCDRVLGDHVAVFDAALPSGPSNRSISPEGHILMMAAVQPFLSGAISKTINLAASATPEDIAHYYRMGWELGLKALAVYRDGCKGAQPVTTKKAEPLPAYGPALVRKLEPGDTVTLEEFTAPAGTETDILQVLAASAGQSMMGDPPFKRGQRKLPKERRGTTWALKLDEHKLYIRSGEYPDGTPGEIFIDLAKEGSTLGGLAGMWAKAVSLCLQYGVPLEELVETFTYTRFEPWGRVLNHPTIKTATSIADLVMRVLAVRYLGRTDLQHVQPDALAADLIPPPTHTVPSSGSTGPVAVATTLPPPAAPSAPARALGDGPPCPQCGTITRRTGTCHACPQCGTSLGCS